MGKLTAGLVRGLKATDKNRRYNDGDGLSLMVRPNGSKAWQVRIVKDGRKTDRGIGSYPDKKLAEARREAQDVRREASAGRELDAPTAPTVPTFAQVADLYLKANAPTWRHPKTAINMRTRFKTYAYPVFGNTPVDGIRRSDVMTVLETVWTAKPAASRKLKQGLSSVFVYALARDWIAVTPVDAAVSQALPKTPATREHFRSLPYQDVPDALKQTDALDRRAIRETVFPMADTHGVTVRGSSKRPMAGHGPTGSDVDNSRRHDEVEPRAPGPAVESSRRRAQRGYNSHGRLRASVPRSQGRIVRHDADKATQEQRSSSSGHRPRIQDVVQDVVHGNDRHALGGRRGRPSSRPGELDGTGLRSDGPIRPPP